MPLLFFARRHGKMRYLSTLLVKKCLILCLCGAVSAPLCRGDWPVISPSTQAEHLLIYRIQSHTNPKRRKDFLKQAGQKSSKEELAEQRKASKRAIKCRLKVPTHIWDRIPRHSNPTRRAKHCQTGLKTIDKQQEATFFLYPFSSFLAIPNAETSQTRSLHRNIFHDKLFAVYTAGKWQKLISGTRIILMRFREVSRVWTLIQPHFSNGKDCLFLLSIVSTPVLI